MRLLELARNVTCADSAIALLTTRNVAKGVFGADLPDRIAMLLDVELDGIVHLRRGVGELARVGHDQTNLDGVGRLR